ncbi:MAG: hypothetical protein IJX46_01035 [Clostridia bacterium]|nr:hypothetical protein [Clostridia bacterium]
MKKLLAILLIAVLCLGVFLVSCGGDDSNPADTTKPGGDVTTPAPSLEGAKAFLVNYYGKDANPTNADYTLSGSLDFQGTVFTVEWTVDVEAVKIVKNDDGSYTVDVDEKSAEDVEYYLTATIKSADGKSITATLKRVVPAYRELTHADFVAAKDGDPVVIQGVVTGIVETSKENDLYLEDEDGGYFVYSLDKKPSEMGIQIGMTVKVSGTRGTYYGVHQVVDASVEIIDETVKEVTPTDITDIFNAAKDTKDATLHAKQSMLVTIKGVTILGQDAGNNTYYNFSLNGKTTYVRISSSTSMIDSAAIKTFESIVKDGIGKTADVTGIVTIYNNAVYLVPVTENAFHDLKVVERTPEEQVKFEKDLLKIDSLYNEAGSYDLPAVGNTYKDVTITWAVSGGDFAKIEGGKLIVSLPEKETKITLTATLKSGDATATATFEVTVAAAPTKIPSTVDVPEANKPYKFYLKQLNNKTTLYLAGGMNGFYLETTTDASKAVDVYLEPVAGKTDEFYLYYLEGTVKNYIKVYEATNTSTGKQVANVGINSGRVSDNTYKYDAELKTLVTTVSVDGQEKTWYLGTYNTFSTFSLSETWRVTGDNASAFDTSNFVCHFATMVDVSSVSDADKVAAEKNALTVPTDMKAESSIDLPLFGTTYSGVTITWTADNALATVEGGKITVGAPTADTEITLTATLKSGSVTETKTFKVTVKAPTADTVTNPVAGTAYLFTLYQGTTAKQLYIDGSVSGRYLGMTTDVTKAVNVYAETAEGGFKFYILVDGMKQYIVIYNNNDGKTSVGFDANGNTVYTYVAETNIWMTNFGGTDMYLGTYSNFETVSASKTSYITAENTGVSQFPLELVPSSKEPEPEIPDSEVIYIEGDGEPEYITFEEALSYAAIATDDVVIKIRKDVTLSQLYHCNTNVAITIEGITSGGKNPVITTGDYSNKFKFTGDKTHTFKNVDIVNEYAKGCLFQIVGGGIVIEGCNITSADQYCMINLMATDGSNQTVTIKDSTLTHTAAQGGNAIITTGNDATSTTEPSWAHWMNAVISIDNSTLVAKETAIKVSAGSTAQITVNGSTLTGGAKDVIVIANPNFLKGESAEIGKTSLTVENTTITPAEGMKEVAYDEACENITVDIKKDEPDTPDTPETPDTPANNKADLETLAPVDSTKTDTSYTDRTTDAGWKATGARSDEQACFGDAPQITLNGKTSALGTLISPVLTGGIKSFSISYGNAFSETNGVSIKINIKNAAGEIVATTDLIDTDVTKEVGESFTWTLDTAVEGDFIIEIINNSPTNADSNKDRVSLWNITWVSAGSSEGGDEATDITGTYVATDDWGNVKNVVIDATKVTISFVHPMTGMEMTNSYAYTFIDGVATIVDDQGAAILGMGLTVTDGVLTGLTDNGTEYAITVAGGDEGGESTGLEGEYNATDDWGNVIDFIVDSENITFKTMRGDTVFQYTYVDGVFTLYQNGAEVTFALLGYVTVENGKIVAAGTNGTDYVITAKGEGGETETTDITGTYTATDDWGNTITIVIDAEKVTFNLPGGNTAEYTYTVENNNVTLYVGGNPITMPMMAYIGLDNNGNVVEAINNGTNYTIATEGGDEGGDEDEELVEIGNGSIDVNTTDTYNADPEFDVHTFTAEVAGTYIFTVPAGLGIFNADQQFIDYFSNAEGDAFEVTLAAGETFTFSTAATVKNAWTITYVIMGTAAEGGEEDTELKALTELKDGDIVIITAPAYNMAFSAEKTGYYNVGKDVSNGFDGLGDAEKFKVTVNADGSYTFTSLTGKVIAMADSFASLNEDGANKSWILIAKAGAEGIFYLKNTVRGNYLEWYASKNNWSSYTPSSPDDQFELSFYKVG